MKHTAFDSYHPLLPVLYFAVVLIFCMAAFQPVLIISSFLGALSYNVYLRGWRASLKTAAWQFPLLIIITLINPFFSASGSTELYRIGTRAIYLESLCYGACMGLMLLSVMLWFSSASHVLSTDKVMAVMGRRLPVISLMISMTLRLVPRFLQSKDAVQTAQSCCSIAQPANMRERVAEGSRLTSVLMGWSMEDSLETADAMRARGWGSGASRTVYAQYRVHRRDHIAGSLFAVLAVVCTVCCYVASSAYTFYPTMTALRWWWGYIPYLLLVFLPSILQLGEWFTWRR